MYALKSQVLFMYMCVMTADHAVLLNAAPQCSWDTWMQKHLPWQGLVPGTFILSWEQVKSSLPDYKFLLLLIKLNTLAEILPSITELVCFHPPTSSLSLCPHAATPNVPVQIFAGHLWKWMGTYDRRNCYVEDCHPLPFLEPQLALFASQHTRLNIKPDHFSKSSRIPHPLVAFKKASPSLGTDNIHIARTHYIQLFIPVLSFSYQKLSS